jgi:CubicO group peptidase (beta-lactamase class C family)
VQVMWRRADPWEPGGVSTDLSGLSAAASAAAPDGSSGALLPALDGLEPTCAFGVGDAGRDVVLHGDGGAVYDLASVSKPLAALGVLVAVAHGLLDLDEPAGPPGASVRHLLAHAAGYAFDADTLLAAPGTRRIYSNTGFEVLGRHLEQATGSSMGEWMEEQVVGPLGLRDVEVTGSPAAGYRGTVTDLLAVGRELLDPTLIPASLRDEACRVQFPGLVGVLPGYGRQDPNDWGLGLEIRDHKQPHWTGRHSDPGTVGHFGQSGSFLWVDRRRHLTAAFLGSEPFGPAHQALWPVLNDQLLARVDGA